MEGYHQCQIGDIIETRLPAGNRIRLLCGLSRFGSGGADRIPTDGIHGPADRVQENRSRHAAAEREERILEWWTSNLSNFDEGFCRVWNAWCESQGLFILLLAADPIVPGYSIQGLRYRCLSHCRVLLDGKVVHDPNPDDRHPWDSLMEPTGVYVIVPRDPTVLLTARQLSVEIPQPAERAAEDRVQFESVR
jgi:hypothetical protein